MASSPESTLVRASHGASEAELSLALNSVFYMWAHFFFPLCFSQMEPKRLKKQLPKMLKLLKPDDRILIVGTTKRPFDAELQPFCKAYQKIILVPRPDYASRYGKYPLTPSRVQPARLGHP